jgi:hypothetical protein
MFRAPLVETTEPRYRVARGAFPYPKAANLYHVLYAQNRENVVGLTSFIPGSSNFKTRCRQVHELCTVRGTFTMCNVVR